MHAWRKSGGHFPSGTFHMQPNFYKTWNPTATFYFEERAIIVALILGSTATATLPNEIPPALFTAWLKNPPNWKMNIAQVRMLYPAMPEVVMVPVLCKTRVFHASFMLGFFQLLCNTRRNRNPHCCYYVNWSGKCLLLL